MKRKLLIMASALLCTSVATYGQQALT
ncbi:hypothetical protein SAMN05444682_112180, partial [Parapedobacter indicus]